MHHRILVSLVLLIFSTLPIRAQYASEDTTYKKFFTGSTLFILGNFIPQNRPDFVQLNLGYRITRKDIVSIELKTWKYAWSLGIPYGKSFEAPDEKFPGYIREFGFALAYQRFWWKGLYTGIHVMNARQLFINENGKKIDDGFQVFNTYRIGYHIKLFKDKFFIQPSIAITHRPYNTKMPESFEELNEKWPKYFIGEPGFHFGFNF